MGEAGITGRDVELLRDILDLTKGPADRSATETTFEVLDRIEQLVRSDGVSFQVMRVQAGGTFDRPYAQTPSMERTPCSRPRSCGPSTSPRGGTSSNSSGGRCRAASSTAPGWRV